MADVVVPTVAVPEAMPRYAMPGDAGADLTCRHDVDLAPGERAMVETGVRVALPDGYVGFVNPRSGLAARHGLSIVNAPERSIPGTAGRLMCCSSIPIRGSQYILMLVPGSPNSSSSR